MPIVWRFFLFAPRPARFFSKSRHDMPASRELGILDYLLPLDSVSGQTERSNLRLLRLSLRNRAKQQSHKRWSNGLEFGSENRTERVCPCLRRVRLVVVLSLDAPRSRTPTLRDLRNTICLILCVPLATVCCVLCTLIIILYINVNNVHLIIYISRTINYLLHQGSLRHCHTS